MLNQQDRLRSFELAKKIEDYILWKLTCSHLNAHESGKPEYDIHEKRFDVYSHFLKLAELERNSTIAVGNYEYQTLTAGFFNRIVDDMKRVGLIGTAKGGSILYLTGASRKKMLAWDSERILPASQTVGGAQ